MILPSTVTEFDCTSLEFMFIIISLLGPLLMCSTFVLQGLKLRCS